MLPNKPENQKGIRNLNTHKLELNKIVKLIKKFGRKACQESRH